MLDSAHADSSESEPAMLGASTALPQAPLVENPKHTPQRSTDKLANADLFVAALAVFVLVVSVLGLYWLFSGN